MTEPRTEAHEWGHYSFVDHAGNRIIRTRCKTCGEAFDAARSTASPSSGPDLREDIEALRRDVTDPTYRRAIEDVLAVLAIEADAASPSSGPDLREAASKAAGWIESVGWHSSSCPAAGDEGGNNCSCGYNVALADLRDALERGTTRD